MDGELTKSTRSSGDVHFLRVVHREKTAAVSDMSDWFGYNVLMTPFHISSRQWRGVLSALNRELWVIYHQLLQTGMKGWEVTEHLIKSIFL